MAVLQRRRPGSLRSSDPRTMPFTREEWREKQRSEPPNVVGWADATPEILLVALRPYRDFAETRAEMNLLDGMRHGRTF